jgi:hypothetical protein
MSHIMLLRGHNNKGIFYKSRWERVAGHNLQEMFYKSQEERKVGHNR